MNWKSYRTPAKTNVKFARIGNELHLITTLNNKMNPDKRLQLTIIELENYLKKSLLLVGSYQNHRYVLKTKITKPTYKNVFQKFMKILKKEELYEVDTETSFSFFTKYKGPHILTKGGDQYLHKDSNIRATLQIGDYK